MAEALYTIDILRLAASTGEWPRLADPHGTAERRSPTCGSRVAVDVTLTPAGTVAALGVGVSACALGQASAALLARHAPGRTHAELLATRTLLADHLTGGTDALPDLSGIAHLAPARAYPARHPSILLPYDALLAAIDAARIPAPHG